MSNHPLIQQIGGKGKVFGTGNVNGNGTGNNTSSRPTFGDKLGLLAGTVTVIGDLLALIAGVVLIQEGIADDIQTNKEKKAQEQQLLNMQTQIENLQKELDSLNKKS